MRVVAGIRRGLRLADFEGRGIRPTTDRIKENIFNIIAPYVPEADVLDMFAGTGAMAIEALSRGARSAALYELAEASAAVVRENIKRAGFENECTLVMGDSIALAKKASEKFDIIFMDPPYNTGLLEKALRVTAEFGLLADGGIAVAECDGPEKPDGTEGLELIKEKKYGRSCILVYTKGQQ